MNNFQSRFYYRSRYSQNLDISGDRRSCAENIHHITSKNLGVRS